MFRKKEKNSSEPDWDPDFEPLMKVQRSSRSCGVKLSTTSQTHLTTFEFSS